jgi:hypothetical protein
MYNYLTNKYTQYQVPRYGIYPLLSGYVPVDLSIYDYEDNDHVPFIDLINKNVIEHLSTVTNQYVIRDDNDNLVINYDEIYKEFNKKFA